MYDALIIGLGAAGYTAAIYCARYKLSTLIVGLDDGGTGLAAAEVGDWPGIEFITGPELMENFKNHALSFEGVEHKQVRVEKVENDGGVFRLTFDDGETVEGRTIIFATGSINRHLGVPGEEALAGKGVTYCATCDAYFYKGKDVVVIGGGDSAVEGAAIAAQVANKVYLVHRRNEFRAEPYWVGRVQERDNVTFVLENNVVEILGDAKVTGVRLDKEFEGSDQLTVDGVFVEIGADPAIALPEQIKCELDDRGHLKVDAGMQTSVAGAFAAGDVSSGSDHFAQFTTAVGEGSVAAHSLFNFLSSGEKAKGGYMSGGE